MIFSSADVIVVLVFQKIGNVMVITIALIYPMNTTAAVKTPITSYLYTNYYFFLYLAQKKCTTDKFTCTNGRCIDKILVCDGTDDCGDLSDEMNCKQLKSEKLCDLDEFACRSNTSICVPNSSRCNSTAECPLKEDEEVSS